MVKGVTRRVIVVKSPDPRYFEEAIFIVKEDAELEGVDASQVIAEARAAANGYVKQQIYRRRTIRRITPLGYVAAGATVSALAMGLVGLLL